MGHAVNERLPRQLAFSDIWLLAVNGTIGAGTFGVPGDAA